jgi:enoyl-CoA hydratase
MREESDARREEGGMSLLVEREDHDGISVLTLNRPDVLNALNMEMFIVLRRHIDQISQDADAVRCVMLRGAGRSFCAGADLKALKHLSPADPPSTFEPDTVTAFANLPQPTIGMIHGHCYTGGLEFALAADILIAAAGSRFADTHAKWGLCSAWGMTHRLPRRIGVSNAKDMMFSAREVDAQEALAMGLVDRVVAAEALEQEALALAKSIAANAPRAVQWSKRTIETCLRSPQDALALERAEHPGLGNEFASRVRGEKW